MKPVRKSATAFGDHAPQRQDADPFAGALLAQAGQLDLSPGGDPPVEQPRAQQDGEPGHERAVYQRVYDAAAAMLGHRPQGGAGQAIPPMAIAARLGSK
ncbi:hypothetical protein CG740_34490 [Streptomyces sp. CB01201]|nr:hypothetical protein CG740_34490 [Streptomyces sp. CB01201]